MKRVGYLYEKLISDENLTLAICEVNRAHKYYKHHRINHTVERIQNHIEEYVVKLRKVIEQGFEQSECRKFDRYDKAACKWRTISEPRLFPDQYVHHALIQVLEPVFMRGMDDFCCGSVKGRGIHYGVKALKKWNKNDVKGTKYCAELDIKHFYQNIQPKYVMDRLRQLVKDPKVLDLAERTLKGGVNIGSYTSQWYANVLLQPLDHLIRECGLKVTHYLRYIDNFTLYSSNKRELHKAVNIIRDWLNKHGLDLKDNWQVFKTAGRYPSALGYRYGHGYTLLRKKNLYRLKRQFAAFYRLRREHKKIPFSMASGLISRIGQLKHCNCARIYKEIVKPFTVKNVKAVIRAYSKAQLQICVA